MGWSALIAMLIQVLGPILVKWLAEWLDDRLRRASAALDFAAYADDHAARDALFDRVLADTPRWMVFRRVFVRQARQAAAEAGVTCQGAAHPLSAETAAILGDIAAAQD